MSELNNPLFEDQRELLERQKEEYKNALLSDVAELKDQSTQIGKNVLMAGGLMVGMYLLGKAFSGNGDKPKKKKGNKLKKSATFKGAEDRAWIANIPDVEDDEPLYSAIERTYPAVYHPNTGTLFSAGGRKKESGFMTAAKSFMQSDLFKAVEHQLAAMLMLYITKLIEERFHVSAALASHQEEPETTDVVYHLQTDEDTHAHQPSTQF
ncbi:hypothetical protein GU926_12585 [Nibribacter ruber]|uniref:Uncharacterized protein n=1 Tax=Nibribacter ruber TaxID=2698458 RepID=A0A6P1P1T3_9BACT|nr:hypothetical protein [Nibribacter ruber]QHL88223.1 hypothetical protein GU926_12585 [Nibribacter ruber]